MNLVEKTPYPVELVFLRVLNFFMISDSEGVKQEHLVSGRVFQVIFKFRVIICESFCWDEKFFFGTHFAKIVLKIKKLCKIWSSQLFMHGILYVHCLDDHLAKYGVHSCKHELIIPILVFMLLHFFYIFTFLHQFVCLSWFQCLLVYQFC